jgi:hypothetical protein
VLVYQYIHRFYTAIASDWCIVLSEQELANRHKNALKKERFLIPGSLIFVGSVVEH